MIDAYLASKGSPEDAMVLEGFEPSQAIIETRYINPDASELNVIFPPWHGAKEVTQILERRLVRNGSAVMAFDFHDHILEPNMPGVIAVHEHMSDSIAEDVNKRRVDEDFERVNLIGISLGSAALSLTASKLDTFTRVTNVVPGSNLAQCMWNGIRTQGIRESFERQGITLDELDKAWTTLGPSYHAPIMEGKEVNVRLSLNDGFVPTEYGEEYVAALQEAGANVSVQRSRLGHAMNIIKFCLVPSR